MTEIKQYSEKRCKKDCGTCGDGAIPHSNGELSLKNPNEVHSVHGMKKNYRISSTKIKWGGYADVFVF